MNKYAAMDGRTNPMALPTRSQASRSCRNCPISSISPRYLGVDPITQLMPIQPTAHYTMGGIPTNKYGEVVIDGNNTVFPGLYAAGECACVSVHGRTVRARTPARPGGLRQARRTQSRGVCARSDYSNLPGETEAAHAPSSMH